MLEVPIGTTTALTTNLSEGGMFVEMTDPPAPGSIITFELLLRKNRVRGVGQVVWTKTTDTSDLPDGIGIEFVAVRDRDQLRKEMTF